MVEVKSIERIKAELQAIQMQLHPLMRDYSPYSPNTVLNESIAIQLHVLQQMIVEKERDLNVFTAHGAALDALVRDRLPQGRMRGTHARGVVKFSAISPPVSDVQIRKGTRVCAFGPDGEMYIFEVAADTTLNSGNDHVYADVVAVESGKKYNVAPGAITQIVTPVPGIDFVTNEEDMTGGTDEEDDESLRSRYIYAPMVTGTATELLVKNHLESIADGAGNRIVREARVNSIGSGDVVITIDPARDMLDDVETISSAIRSNLAAGITACGIKTATIRGDMQIYDIEDSAGGYVWVRCAEPLKDGAEIILTYVDTHGAEHNATAEIPANVPTGYCVKAELDNDILATTVTGSDYEGSGAFDIFIGLGEYPALYTTVEYIKVNVNAVVRVKRYAGDIVKSAIENSIRHLLSMYRIGDAVEYTDVMRAVLVDTLSGSVFDDVDDVSTLVVSTEDESINSVGQKLIIEPDGRVVPGAINVEIL